MTRVVTEKPVALNDGALGAVPQGESRASALPDTLRVLKVHNHYKQPGGEDESFADESRLLTAHGHEVISYTAHNRTIDLMWPWQLVAKTHWNSQVYNEVRKLCRERRPHVMHCTNTFPLISPAVYYAARAEHVPVVQSLRNYRLICPNGLLLRNGAPCELCVGRSFAAPAIAYGCYRESRAASAVVASMLAWHRWRRTWKNAVDAYFVPTQFARSKFVQGGLPEEKLFVKPNFVEPDPGPGNGAGNFVLFAGRLSEEKGLKTLLAAWELLQERVPLHIVGDGPLSPLVEAACQRDDRIRWTGRSEPLPLLELLGDAKLLVYPSICYETFGRTMVEAFSRGTPVIASRLGAMAELVEANRSGELFTPGDARDLALRVAELWTSPGRLHALRRGAREAYGTRFSGRANLETLLDIYEQAHLAAVAREAAS